MANFQLPAATSVVDYLNTKGQDSSFGARQKLYSTSGLDKRLGDFTGTSSQNLALLDYLKAGSAPAPSGGQSVLKTANAPAFQPTLPGNTPGTNAIDFSKINVTPAPGAQSVLKTAGAPAFQPTLPGNTPGTDVIDFSKITSGVVDPSRPGAAPASPAPFSFLSNPGVGGPPDFTKITAGVIDPSRVIPPAAPATSALQTVAPSTPAPSADGTAPNGAATDATTSTITTDSIAPGASQSESDLIDQFLNSEEGQALTDKQQRGELDAEEASAEAKRLLEVKYASDKTTLEQNLAKSGLAFSGIRNTQLKSLVDNLGASELNLDRQLASKLLDSNADLRDGILKGVSDLIKAAADKDDAAHKEAIQQLNAVGLAVVGDKIVPTLASRNADRAAAQQEVANARAQANLEISEQRLEIAERSADLAAKRFEQLYGAGKGDLFNNVQALIDKAPDATEQDIRLAIRANPDVFGNPSEAELTDALSLVGIPSARQNTIAINAVASLFEVPSIFSRILPGDQTAAAFTDAKTKAKQALVDSKGVIQYTDESGKETTYKLNSNQLQALIARVDTVTEDEAKDAQ